MFVRDFILVGIFRLVLLVVFGSYESAIIHKKIKEIEDFFFLIVFFFF